MQSRGKASSGLARAAEHRGDKSRGVGALTKSRGGASSFGQEEGDQAWGYSSRAGQDEDGPGENDAEFRKRPGAGGRSGTDEICPEGRPAGGGLDGEDGDDEVVGSGDGAHWRCGSDGEDRPIGSERERDDLGHEARRRTTETTAEQRWSGRLADGVRGHSELARTGEKLQSELSRTRGDAPWLRAQPDVLEADVHSRPTTSGDHRRERSGYPVAATAGAPPPQQRDSAPGFGGTTTNSSGGSPPQSIGRQWHNGTVRPSSAAPAAAVVADTPSPAAWIAPDQVGNGAPCKTGGFEDGNPMAELEENGSNRRSDPPWERPPASEFSQNDKYDPLRYKTTASGTQGGLDSVPARDAAGDWTGAARTSAPHVSWAEEGDRQPGQRLTPSRGKADTRGIRHREQADGQAASIADGAPHLFPDGPEGNRYHNSTDHPHQDWRTKSQSDHRGAIEGEEEGNATRQRLQRIAATELSEDTDTLSRSGTVQRDHPSASVDVANHLEVSTHLGRQDYDEGVRTSERAKRATQGGVAVAAMSQREGAEEGRASPQVGSRGGGGVGGGREGGKVEHVLRDGRRVILFANGTQKVGGGSVQC